MPTRPPAASRRAVLGAALLGLAGCADDLDPTPDDPTITPTSGPSTVTPSAPTSPTASPVPTPADDGGADDEALVDEVLTALALAHRTARANARNHGELRALLTPFERLHARHGADLGDLPRTTGRVTDPAESREAVLARVDRTEDRLERTLVDAAVAAGSGALAQTFASMAAATTQLRAELLAGAS